MSGHNRWSKVKRIKGPADAKKGKLYTKLIKEITVAAKMGGGNPDGNARLRTAIQAAKDGSMPKENIERAIKKGTGELVGENLEEVSFEGFGPAGITLIIDGITDNKNRTLGEIKGILGQYGGKLAGEGAVRWMFEKKGVVTVNPEGKSQEDIELLIIESGAEDFKVKDLLLEVYTKPEELELIKKTLEEKGMKIENASIEFLPKEEVSIDEKEKEKAQKLFEALDENDAIQNIYSNLKS
jgi:YebC/PmpR family DNA-binding regulatory protein